jgi:thiamine biosynthesis lipoprotein
MPQQIQLDRLMGIASVALVAGVPAAASAATPAVAGQTFEYHHGEVLGTALDLTVVATNRADADAAKYALLDEVQRLAKILSAYDADAELARLNASPVGGVNGMGMRVSPELIEVLKQYDGWSKRSEGAYSGHVGELVELWKRAEADHRLPGDAALLAAAQRCAAPAWEINESVGTVKRIADQQINVDSLGKGFIIDHAVAAATAHAPAGLKGLLLNVGGDLRTWGAPAAGGLWAVGIQDPAHPELNAKPLTTVYVGGGRSVSTSGAYQRFYTVDGQRYSHILDARTGQPAREQSATVVAADSATANALATACCTLRFADAFALVRSVPGAECLIVTADGQPLRTDGFKELENAAQAAERSAVAATSQFPAGFQLSIALETVQTQHRPYVAAWVTDGAGHHVRTLAVYGNEQRYQADLRQWWKLASTNRVLRSMSHATQRSGQYPLTWDGTDQRGGGVPLGKYTVWVEVASEHGPYAARFASIDLGTTPAKATIPASSAFAAVTLAYGPGGK